MAKKLVSDMERVQGKYLVDAASGCWNWTARLDKDGYAAQLKIGSRTDGSRTQVRPHRWVYEQLKTPIPEGLVIDHLCRNRRCLNPDHMEPVTPLENHHRGLRAKATVCPKGHPIEGDNEVARSHGIRCRTCRNAWYADYHRRTGHKHSNAYKQRKRSEKSVLEIG